MRLASKLFFTVLHEVRKNPDIMYALRYAQLSGYQKAMNQRNVEPSFHHRANILGAK